MSTETVSPLRERMIEDMNARKIHREVTSAVANSLLRF
jgi:hypothetical protein